MERKKGYMSEASLKNRLNKKIANGDPVTRLAAVRLSLGITQKELALRSGLKQPYIARIESDKTPINGITMINGFRLASALGCRMEDLVEKVQ